MFFVYVYFGHVKFRLYFYFLFSNVKSRQWFYFCWVVNDVL